MKHHGRGLNGFAGARMRGISLIELMVALVLGLIVVGAAGSIFVTNSQTYKATDSLGRVQETSRVAFELMARDIREAAGNPCSKNIPVGNVINSPGSNWWAMWGDGVKGYDGATLLPGHPFGTTNRMRAAGTDAIDLRSGYSGGTSVEKHTANSANFQVNSNDHGLQDGDIAMVCDFTQAAIFQSTNVQSGINKTVVHNTGTGTPGNCTKGLGYANPMDCSTNGTAYEYGKNSVLVKLRATQWYIGHNGKGGLSLYQASLNNSGGNLSTVDNEITDGVTDMTLEYLVENAVDYVAAAAVTDWKKVKAVRLLVDLEGKDKVGTAGEKIQRQLRHVATIRNRVE